MKRGSVWEIAHFQNTTVDPDAEKHDPIPWDESGFRPGKTRMSFRAKSRRASNA